MSVNIKEIPSLCYQCGKCSAGCPVAEEMEVLPHQIMHYLSIGMEDKAMKADTAWMCAGCFTCSVRCPNDIDITSVMDGIRIKAQEKVLDCPRPDVLTFHKTFLKSIERRGRIHEMRMMTEYNIRTGRPLNNAGLAPHMLLKNRLHILPPRAIKGFSKWMRRLRKRS